MGVKPKNMGVKPLHRQKCMEIKQRIPNYYITTTHNEWEVSTIRTRMALHAYSRYAMARRAK